MNNIFDHDIILDALSDLRAPLIKSFNISFTRMAILSPDKFDCHLNDEEPSQN